MRKLKFILIFCVLTITLFSCSKEDQVINSQDTYEKLATIMQVTSDAAKIYQDTVLATDDDLRAIHAVGNFLADNENVSAAYYMSPELIDIEFKNGLNSSISAVEINDAGDYTFAVNASMLHFENDDILKAWKTSVKEARN